MSNVRSIVFIFSVCEHIFVISDYSYLHGNMIIWIVMHTYETIWLCLVAPQHDQLQ